MARRSPARWLAPLALVAFAFALVTVLGSSTGDETDRGNDTAAPATSTTGGDEAEGGEGGGEEAEGGRGRDRKHYVVKPGDTPSQIADRTGVSLDQIEELNPDLDPQLLAPGERIRIRP